MCKPEDFNSLKLTDNHRALIRNELSVWHACYLPVGKTVLDVGAGAGETAQFYLNHGAERVICVEGDPNSLELLKLNFGDDHRITIIPAFVDSVKVDIEGKEEGLVVETHFHPVFNPVWRPWRGLTLWRLERGRESILDKLYWRSRIVRRILKLLKLRNSNITPSIL